MVSPVYLAYRFFFACLFGVWFHLSIWRISHLSIWRITFRNRLRGAILSVTVSVQNERIDCFCLRVGCLQIGCVRIVNALGLQFGLRHTDSPEKCPQKSFTGKMSWQNDAYAITQKTQRITQPNIQAQPKTVLSLALPLALPLARTFT